MITMYHCKRSDLQWINYLQHKNYRFNFIDLRINLEPPKSTPHWQGFIVDLNCPQLQLKFNNSEVFFQPHQSYVLIGEISVSHLKDVLRFQSGILLDSDISIFTPTGFIWDLYRIDNAQNVHSKIIINRNGEWNASGIFNYDASTSKVPHRFNLQGIQFPSVIYVSMWNDRL